MLKYLEISKEVQNALKNNQAVVALESTIISHGMPYPQNVETALNVEKIVRDNNAVPATIAIIGGIIKVGLSPEEIDYIGKRGHDVVKVSRRDIASAVVKKLDGATTVSATMIIANMAGIKVFATGGIGGVHRHATSTMDISADLDELSRTPVLVVCAGAKAILDLPLTREYLETKGVTVCGYQTFDMPAFYSKTSGLKVDYNVKCEKEMADIFQVSLDIHQGNGMLLTVPIPDKYALDDKYINQAIDQAIDEADLQGINGKEVTPFLLAKIVEITGGKSLEANIQLVYNNVAIASRIAVEMSK